VLSGTYAMTPVVALSTGIVKVAFRAYGSNAAAGFTASWSSVLSLPFIWSS